MLAEFSVGFVIECEAFSDGCVIEQYTGLILHIKKKNKQKQKNKIPKFCYRISIISYMIFIRYAKVHVVHTSTLRVPHSLCKLYIEPFMNSIELGNHFAYKVFTVLNVGRVNLLSKCVLFLIFVSFFVFKC